MEKILYSTNDCWGMTYIFKRGYKRITSNMDDIPSDWVARFYYKDKDGNVFLKNKKGRKLYIEMNSNIDLYADDFMVSIRDEIGDMKSTMKEMQKAYPGIEKLLKEPNIK